MLAGYVSAATRDVVAARAQVARSAVAPQKMVVETRFSLLTVLCWPGDSGGASTPDPIPNSSVKSSSADGTKSQDLGE